MLMKLMVVLAAAGLTATQAHAIDAETRQRGEDLAERMAAYLTEQQGDNGGWMHNPDGPNLPAITGLVVSALHGVGIDAEAQQRGADYLRSFVQPDGGVYDRILPTYNTAIALSALAKLDLNDPLVKPAQRFLIGLQYSEDAMLDLDVSQVTARVDRNHPFYGGIGYGNNSRPDGSNMHFFLRALEDSGYAGEDVAVQRALVFLSRVQMLDDVNDMPYADGSSQGGFIYATAPNGERVGEGESKGGEIEELTPDGETVSRLRAYGSMTYAGFRAFAYAELQPDDPRVAAAAGWIESNYTLEENPGIGTDGYYYYLMTFGRALEAWSRMTGSGEVAGNDWRGDLITQLEEQIGGDGALVSVDDRWMENNPVLITSYGLIALGHALHEED